MKFKGTRGGPGLLTFEEAVLRGYAPGGGMLVPVAIPRIDPATLRSWQGLTFAALCEEVFSLFIDEEDVPRADLRALLSSCFDEFVESAVVPIRRLGTTTTTTTTDGSTSMAVVELFHGPTLAFKDLGLQFIGRLFEYLVGRRSRRLSILVATSGDTGE